MLCADSASAGSHKCARWSRLAVALVIILLVGASLDTGSSAVAATNQTLIIRDDKGGNLAERARLINAYRADGIRVEIRGSYCLSACTMYLGLSDTCVAPDTTFGFHGPSSGLYGVALSAASFDRWSRVMADYYPEPIRSWFLTTGRNRTVGFHEFSGRELIGMGIRGCTG